MEKFKEVLQELISQKELSISQVCLESGVSSTLMYDYLNGLSYPSAKMSIKLANYFDCSLDYLFDLSTIKKDKNYPTPNGNFELFLPRYLQLLKENHTTHYLFAQDHKFGESIIRGWKKGAIPSIEKLKLIAFELGSSIDYLLGRI